MNCNSVLRAMDIECIRNFSRFFLWNGKRGTMTAVWCHHIYIQTLLQFHYGPMRFYRNLDIRPIRHVA